MVNTLVLNEAIKRSGKKIDFLAKQCGITRQAFANKRDGRSEFTAKEIKILRTELGITSLRELESIFFA